MPNTVVDPLNYLRQAYRSARVRALGYAGTKEFQGFEAVGVVGAGIMGASIAAIHLQKLIPVTLVDSQPEALERAKSDIKNQLELGACGQVADQLLAKLLSVSSELSDLRNCDLVIESIVEKCAAKQSLLSEIERCVSDETVIASNTSTIPIGRLAKGLRIPERFCGLHFCHPVPIRPLVEVVAGPATNAETCGKTLFHAAMLDQLPIMVADGHGFVVNRLLLPYIGEGLALLGEGVPAEQVDGVAKEFGMALGPLEMLDGIGLDTALHSGLIMSEVAAERMAETGLLVALVKGGDLGRKTGLGIFTHPSHELNQRLRNLLLGRFKPVVVSEYDSARLLNRLLLPMVLEAVRIVEDQKVADSSAIDLAAVYGLGFPATRGGPLAWADHVGAENIIKLLGELPELGGRGRPPALLTRTANDARSLAAWPA